MSLGSRWAWALGMRYAALVVGLGALVYFIASPRWLLAYVPAAAVVVADLFPRQLLAYGMRVSLSKRVGPAPSVLPGMLADTTPDQVKVSLPWVPRIVRGA